MEWVVYILKCNDGTLSTGITNNFKERLAAHQKGNGAKYTKGRGPFKTLMIQKCMSRSEASKIEYHIKTLSRRQKLDYIEKHSSTL